MKTLKTLGKNVDDVAGRDADASQVNRRRVVAVGKQQNIRTKLVRYGKYDRLQG
jgi:hypothetical protein